MEISTVEKIKDLKEKGILPLCSIWIVEVTEKQELYDVNVWDEIENEREEFLEEANIETLKEAEIALQRIVDENPQITFVRLANEQI